MTTTEEWRPVVGYEGYYEVSNLGRVRSVDRVVIRSDGQPRSYAGKMLKHGTKTGYSSVRLSRDGRGPVARVHRLVALAFLGPQPDGMEVCHNDGNRLNPRLENLRWDTHVANVRDAANHGTLYNARVRTRCKNGHELSPDNIRLHSEPFRRVCLTCERVYGRTKAAKKSSQRAAARKAREEQM